MLVPNHKGEGVGIGKVIESYLLEWRIHIIFTITVENASSNNVAIDYTLRKTKDEEDIILGYEFLHMHCCALNLIVRDG